jgi:fibronectin type 3 domain-containing protein
MQGGKYKTLWILAGVVVAAGIQLSAYRLAGNRSGSNQEPHSVTLTWTPAANATSYNVYRGQVSGGPYEKIGTSSTAKYVDKPVPSRTTLYYVVTTVSSAGESKYSKEIKAVVP